ncbi:NapC/NirT family cytochrome c [Ideonella sp. DXS29W]|uniref:Cytochrome c-type protein n=1 Tax=Ideonella lacteola TaxID=2984193 RepID=A0ABU9BLH4_9BURK
MTTLWRRFRRQGRWTQFFGVQALLWLLVGVGISIAGQATVAHTNTLEFCISCHEMKDNNYTEYSHTIHARNRTGVKAVCSDCHVPHDLAGTVVRKIGAAKDVWSHFTGKIDTPAQFEAHRLEMAQTVWRRMKQTDSSECRHCHDVQAMDPELQGKTAQKQHQKMRDGSRTCIDCHYGIAHKEPGGGAEPQDAVADPS